MQLFYPFQRPFFEFIVRSRGNFHFSPRQTLLKPNKTEATRGFERKIKSCARWITRGIVTRFKNRPAKILESEKLRLLSFLSFFFPFFKSRWQEINRGPTRNASPITRADKFSAAWNLGYFQPGGKQTFRVMTWPNKPKVCTCPPPHPRCSSGGSAQRREGI